MMLSGLVTILTALIGLIGVYIAFALIVSWILEQIASVAQLRSKTLTLALRQFLGGEANDFFALPMLRSLGEPFDLAPTFGMRLARGTLSAVGVVFGLLPGSTYTRKFLSVELPDKTQGRVPSYLSSRDFVSGLLTYVSQSALAKRLDRAQAALADVQKLPPDVKKLLPAAVAAAGTAESLAAAAETDLAALASVHVDGDLQSVVDSLRELGQSGSLLRTGDAAISEAARLNQDLAAAIDALSPGPLREMLAARLRDADGNYQRFIASIQSWFDDYMDRVSGWYKRCAGTLTLYLGIAVVIALNVDSIAIFGTLIQSQQLASISSAFATSLLQANAPVNAPQTGATPAPTDAALAAQRLTLTCPDGTDSATCATCPAGYRAAAKDCVVDLNALSALPLGWPDRTLANRLSDGKPQVILPALLLKVLGWTFTVVALALGAPFWFDLLGTIVNVRNAGSVPPRAAQSSQSPH